LAGERESVCAAEDKEELTGCRVGGGRSNCVRQGEANNSGYVCFSLGIKIISGWKFKKNAAGKNQTRGFQALLGAHTSNTQYSQPSNKQVLLLMPMK